MAARTRRIEIQAAHRRGPRRRAVAGVSMPVRRRAFDQQGPQWQAAAVAGLAGAPPRGANRAWRGAVGAQAAPAAATPGHGGRVDRAHRTCSRHLRREHDPGIGPAGLRGKGRTRTRPKLHLPALGHAYLSLWCHGMFVIWKAVRDVYVLTTSPSGRAQPLVKWLRRTRLLKRVDRARLTGRHSHTQTNALPRCSPRTAAVKRSADLTWQSLSRGSWPFREHTWPALCPPALLTRSQGILLPPTSAGSPYAFAARLGRSFLC